MLPACVNHLWTNLEVKTLRLHAELVAMSIKLGTIQWRNFSGCPRYVMYEHSESTSRLTPYCRE